MDEHLSVLTWERTALAYKGQQKFEEERYRELASKAFQRRV